MQLYSNDIADDETYIRNARFDPGGNLVAVPGDVGHAADLLRKSYLIRFIRKAYLQLEWVLSSHTTEQTTIGGYVEENPDITHTSAQFIRKLSDEVGSSGAHFYLTVIPSKSRVESVGQTHDELEFSQKWERWARAQNIGFIDLVTPFHEARRKKDERLFYENDIHLNKNGHRVVAGAISSSLPDVFSVCAGVAQQRSQ